MCSNLSIIIKKHKRKNGFYDKKINLYKFIVDKVEPMKFCLRRDFLAAERVLHSFMGTRGLLASLRIPIWRRRPDALESVNTDRSERNTESPGDTSHLSHSRGQRVVSPGRAVCQDPKT